MRTVILTGVLLDEEVTLTLADLSRACEVDVEWIIHLVDEGILEPDGVGIARWSFPASSLHRARTARRLQRDLNINLAGAALALELMEEIENLRVQLRMHE